jgi:hypothetical protein
VTITNYHSSVKTHGLSNHSLYRLYGNIKYKCRAKHIPICDRWNNSFKDFYDDLIPSFVEGSSLYRTDLKKGFELSNIYWKPPIKRSTNNFGKIEKKLDLSIKVIETLTKLDSLDDSKGDIKLILKDVINNLKSQIL